MRIKTSLAIKPATLRKLKREAIRQQRSVSFLVNSWVEERMTNGKAIRQPEPATR